MSDLERCEQRAQALALRFTEIHRTRMSGLPVLNPHLQVQAVGFEPACDALEPPAALGVLVTPWFMNLVWLPLRPAGELAGRERAVGGLRFSTLAVFEPGLGGLEVCSLFSPMFEFADQEAAVATAQAVLAALRAAAAGRSAPAAPAMPAAPGVLQNARRSFLLGRGAGAA